jgi:hypothetical protein
MASKTKKTRKIPWCVRISPHVKAQIHEIARQDKRSTSAQLELIVEEWMAQWVANHVGK